MGENSFREHLEDPKVPLVIKMGEFVQRGPSLSPSEFFELWKIVRVHTWKVVGTGPGLTERERDLQRKLFKMARYKKQAMRGQSR